MAYMTKTQIIDTDGVLDPERLETIDEIIQALLITRKGTIPGSRSFGLSTSIIGSPGPDAINLIAVDLSEAVATYAPEVQLDKIDAEENESDGTLTLNIYLGGR